MTNASMTNTPVKKLSLNKETIRTLTPAELDDVAGGTSVTIPVSILTATLTGVVLSMITAKM